ncbi:MAG: hypothetical protein J6X48_11110 [Lachnospiraceae bacterium]|nr:hypothetical protein [Lachnospiraceae bacterium]
MRIELNDKTDEAKEEYISPATVMTEKGERVLNPTKGMSPGQKIGYYARYYLPKALFILLLLTVTFFLLFTALRKKTPAVNILLVNHHKADTEDIKETLKPYLSSQGLPASSAIEINASVNIDLSNFATYEDKNVFDTLIATRTFSLMFSDEETFEVCAETTYFRYLNEYLTEEEINSYGEENILRGYDDLTNERYICGLKLTRENCEWLTETNYENACVGILFSDVPDEKIKPLLNYILTYKKTGSN